MFLLSQQRYMTITLELSEKQLTFRLQTESNPCGFEAAEQLMWSDLCSVSCLPSFAINPLNGFNYVMPTCDRAAVKISYDPLRALYVISAFNFILLESEAPSAESLSDVTPNAQRMRRQSRRRISIRVYMYIYIYIYIYSCLQTF